MSPAEGFIICTAASQTGDLSQARQRNVAALRAARALHADQWVDARGYDLVIAPKVRAVVTMLLSCHSQTAEYIQVQAGRVRMCSLPCTPLPPTYTHTGLHNAPRWAQGCGVHQAGLAWQGWHDVGGWARGRAR